MGGRAGTRKSGGSFNQYANSHGPAQLQASGAGTTTEGVLSMQSNAPNNTKLATVNFHGHSLTVITTGDGQYLVAMRPICEGIGLSWQYQLNRIKRDEVLSACVFSMNMQMPGDDQKREQTFLPLEYLNGWLFGIETNRCPEELRPALLRYRRECYAVLAAHRQKAEESPVPSLVTRRWLVSFDHQGKEQITSVPMNACVMSSQEFLKAITEPNGLMIDTEELFDFAMAVMAMLKQRADWQAGQLQRLRQR